MIASLGFGVLPSIPWIKDVIRHEQSGLLVDPKRGLIYGANGTPIGGVCADGYVRLGGRSGYLYAHRVIYEVVHGEIPAGLEIDHRNSKRADNRIVNLDAVTHSENVRRAVANGQAPVGEARSDAKLTETLVREIRAAGDTVTLAEWSRRLNLNSKTIKAARDGTSWRHVPMRGRAKPDRRRRSSQRPRRRPE